jgi:Holliday junction DNA helicase RuvA
MTFHALHGLLEHTGIDPLTGDPLFVINLPNQGIAYELHTTQRTLQNLPPIQTDCRVYVYTHIRAEEQKLVGFLSRPERELFRLLMGANGVGLKMALAILEALPLSELIEAILSENYKTLTVAKGVGNKLAQKMILDLKEKLIVWQERFAQHLPVMGTPSSGQHLHTLFDTKALTDAQQVLGSLGYETTEIMDALLRLTSVAPPTETTGYNSETLLKALLKQLH